MECIPGNGGFQVQHRQELGLFPSPPSSLFRSAFHLCTTEAMARLLNKEHDDDDGSYGVGKQGYVIEMSKVA